MYVTGSNDGHVFVCDARVSNNFKVLGHLGTNDSIVVCLLFFYHGDSLFIFIFHFIYLFHSNITKINIK